MRATVEGGKEPSSRLNVQCCHITPRAISLSVCEAGAVRAGAPVVGRCGLQRAASRGRLHLHLS